MSEPLELKKTLNLPKTDFPMKASLPLNEPKQLEAWQEANLYQRILDARNGMPLFVLHDGPPYPTGTIHLGTGDEVFELPSSTAGRRGGPKLSIVPGTFPASRVGCFAASLTLDAILPL